MSNDNRKYENGNVVMVTLPRSQFPKELCQDYYIINRENVSDNSTWTCMAKELYNDKIELDFDRFFDEMTVDGLCMVVPYSKDITKCGGDEYHYFAFGRMETKYWLCIKKCELPKSDDIVLKVPDYLAGRVIGVRGMNVKKVAYALKRHVHVETGKRHVVVN